MLRNKIAVLRGGTDNLHDISLKSGGYVLKALDQKYHVDDIVLDREGNWFKNGNRVVAKEAFSEALMVFNALHGECSKIQRFLESFDIRYTGSGALANGLSLNKTQSKKLFSEHGIQTPYAKQLNNLPGMNPEVMAVEVFRSMPLPVILKPVNSGSSLGIHFAYDFDSLLTGIKELLIDNDKLIIEEYIRGKEASVGVIESFRGHDTYPLMPVEIEKTGAVFSYESKYTGDIRKSCPGSFTEDEKSELSRVASLAHEILDLKHYSNSDFIVHPTRGVFLLETNALPALHEESIYPSSLDSVGSNYSEFLDHLIELTGR
ncbi:MAG: D-alanine-D-alanine ligase [Candidatus Paceibacteria bacterium]|jgi:D-alanine-D-alanine ligase